jgi:hypothetical protein
MRYHGQQPNGLQPTRQPTTKRIEKKEIYHGTGKDQKRQQEKEHGQDPLLCGQYG